MKKTRTLIPILLLSVLALPLQADLDQIETLSEDALSINYHLIKQGPAQSNVSADQTAQMAVWQKQTDRDRLPSKKLCNIQGCQDFIVELPPFPMKSGDGQQVVDVSEIPTGRFQAQLGQLNYPGLEEQVAAMIEEGVLSADVASKVKTFESFFQSYQNAQAQEATTLLTPDKVNEKLLSYFRELTGKEVAKDIMLAAYLKERQKSESIESILKQIPDDYLTAEQASTVAMNLSSNDRSHNAQSFKQYLTALGFTDVKSSQRDGRTIVVASKQGQPLELDFSAQGKITDLKRNLGDQRVAKIITEDGTYTTHYVPVGDNTTVVVMKDSNGDSNKKDESDSTFETDSESRNEYAYSIHCDEDGCLSGNTFTNTMGPMSVRGHSTAKERTVETSIGKDTAVFMRSQVSDEETMATYGARAKMGDFRVQLVYGNSTRSMQAPSGASLATLTTPTAPTAPSAFGDSTIAGVEPSAPTPPDAPAVGGDMDSTITELGVGYKIAGFSYVTIEESTGIERQGLKLELGSREKSSISGTIFDDDTLVVAGTMNAFGGTTRLNYVEAPSPQEGIQDEQQLVLSHTIPLSGKIKGSMQLSGGYYKGPTIVDGEDVIIGITANIPLN